MHQAPRRESFEQTTRAISGLAQRRLGLCVCVISHAGAASGCDTPNRKCRMQKCRHAIAPGAGDWGLGMGGATGTEMYLMAVPLVVSSQLIG